MMLKRRKRCRVCGEEFRPRRSTQKACSPSCALSLAREERQREQRRRDRERLEELRPLSDLVRDAQRAFNAYIRARDAGLPCISCGTLTAGQYHAGHYRTTKAAPQLRFRPDNVHRQCAQCNNAKSGNIVDYRLNLVRRIGEERVRALECDQSSANYSREQMRRAAAVFRRRARHLPKIRAAQEARKRAQEEREF